MRFFIIFFAFIMLMGSCKKDKTSDKSQETGASTEENLSTDSKGLGKEIRKDTSIKKNSIKNIGVQKNPDGSYRFKYVLEKGSTYPLYTKNTEKQSINSMGQSMTVTVDKETNMNFYIKGIQNGIYQIDVTFESYGEKLSANGQTASFHTNQGLPKEKELQMKWKIYKVLTGSTFYAEMDSLGNIKKVSGISAIRKKVMAKIKPELKGEEGVMLDKMLEQSFNDQVVKLQLEQNKIVFPDKTIKMGGDWTNSQTINENGVNGKGSNSTILKSVSPAEAKFTLSGNNTLSGSRSQGGIQLTTNVNGKMNGEVTIDAKSCWVKKAVMTETVTALEKLSGNGETAEGKTVTTTTTRIN